MRQEIGIFVSLWLGAAIIVVTVFGLAKLGGAMFNIASDTQEQQSLAMCSKEHGTPVLENDGDAYKSCAINGQSHTSNVTK